MISLIIPVYNEANHLENTVKTVESYMKKNFNSWEIIISEDGSTDNSYEIGQKLAKKNKKIKILHSEKRLGKGGGIKHGIKASKGDIIIFYDADMAVPVTEIKKHLNLLKKYDFILGSRDLEKAKISKRQPAYRELLGKGFNKLIQISLGVSFKDTQCGFKYFKREVLESILPELKVDGFAFDVEIILAAQKRGYKGIEVPVLWQHVENSKVNVFTATPQMFFDVMRLFFRYSR